MAATEYYLIPYKMAAIKWDPAIVREEPFTDVVTRKISLIKYKRITGNILVCEVDCATGGVRFPGGTKPPPQRITVVNGITEFEII